ncbi:SOS response-associated peptidase [Candidatus Poribacteria bacterium]|nr:SOS response-associated peptidase [Candidatus Poribacteria bacterium]
MCGRFTMATPSPELARLFDLEEMPTVAPRYNVSPTQNVLGIRARGEDGSQREAAWLRWGLIPGWAKDPSIGARMINARSETAAEKPSFRTPLRRRRCLIPADGFYEWRRTGSQKQPYLVRVRGGEPFAFGGIWDVWRQGDDVVIESCAILTTEPNDLMVSIHDRMPVIIRPEEFDLWIDPSMQKPGDIAHLMAPFPASEMDAIAVTTRVNNPANDDPQCAVPAAAIS